MAVMPSVLVAEKPAPQANIVLAVGAAGTEDYGKQFLEWTANWKTVAEKANAKLTIIGDSKGDSKDVDALEKAIKSLPADAPGWIVLIGHGTYANKIAKFNLRGPDVSATQMAQWLKDCKSPIVLVNCASSSAPFINKLSGANRVIVTATRSGSEFNFARFGKYFAEAIVSADSDIDHDDEVSVHEAFLRASAEVKQFYEADARIMSEHALIDDNGDGRGTPANMYRGIRPIGKAKDGANLDGRKAKGFGLSPSGKSLALTQQQKKRRDEIENQLETLRLDKGNLSEQEYDEKLEPLMLELAKIYAAAEEANK